MADSEKKRLTFADIAALANSIKQQVPPIRLSVNREVAAAVLKLQRLQGKTRRSS